MDYREVLLPEALREYQNGALPLGRAVHPQKGPAQPFALDFWEVRRHVAVIGTAGSGKTRNVLVPWTVGALFDDLSVVVVDVKGDYGEEVRDFKQTEEISGSRTAFLWDVNEPDGSRPWNPIAEIRTGEDASQLATAFLGEVDPESPQVLCRSHTGCGSRVRAA